MDDQVLDIEIVESPRFSAVLYLLNTELSRERREMFQLIVHRYYGKPFVPLNRGAVLLCDRNLPADENAV
ncbi:MAG: hypothetical protein ABI560_11785 [Myxococcales bacterium]